MRTKVITLCDETWRMAKQMPNFSRWVRAQLLANDEHQIEERKAAIAFKEEHGRFPKWWGESS